MLILSSWTSELDEIVIKSIWHMQKSKFEEWLKLWVVIYARHAIKHVHSIQTLMFYHIYYLTLFMNMDFFYSLDINKKTQLLRCAGTSENESIGLECHHKFMLDT